MSHNFLQQHEQARTLLKGWPSFFANYFNFLLNL